MGYKAYKSISGVYQMEHYLLHIDHIQSDPFADPSRMRIKIPWDYSGYDPEIMSLRSRALAALDFISRKTSNAAANLSRHSGLGNSGRVIVDSGRQQILERTSVTFSSDGIELRLSMGLPADGRRVLGREAERMLVTDLNCIIESGVRLHDSDKPKFNRWINTAEDQSILRQQIEQKKLVAWIADGAVLARASGIDDRPMSTDRVIPFYSPQELEVLLETYHHGIIRGCGIPAGVTLIVGGGYHGKSTLLRALERGVYDHIPGDGREMVFCDPTAVKIRAEDGRRVTGVNISSFIDNLPMSQGTESFNSENASGSTSQATNIIEALEMGCRVLLLDEDTSATNFMVRDARMQRLVEKDGEPIIPFIDRVRQLYVERGVSTVIVIGGTGDYLDVADNIVRMVDYRAKSVTDEARIVARELPCQRLVEAPGSFPESTPRILGRNSLDPYRGNRIKAQSRGIDTIFFGDEIMDLSAVEQLVDPSQARAIVEIILYCSAHFHEEIPIAELVNKVYRVIQKDGLDRISRYYGQHPGDLALPRKFEVAAAINRLRTLQIR